MKPSKIAIPTLDDMLSYFPEIELPVTLAEESAEAFSKNNKPLPPQIISEYIMKWETEEADEMTEFVPCLTVTKTEDFIGLVYWKASLLVYEFILVSITHAGDLISKKVIASTKLDGDIVKKSAAVIDEDLIVHIVAGATYSSAGYEPSSSQSFSMEFMEKGEIVFSKDKGFLE